MAGSWQQPLFALVCTIVALFISSTLHGCGETEPKKECSDPGEDCHKTECCNDASMKCYEKNQYWASCRASCTPGIDPDDPPEDQTKWSCAPIPAEGNATTPAPPNQTGVPEGWTGGTWTTGYWDCCKPSCAWEGKGTQKTPVRACDAKTGDFLNDTAEKSVCDGGSAATCASMAPMLVNDGMAYGFAAAAVGDEKIGLTGDDNCGQCFELKFVDTMHDGGTWGGAHEDLVGKRMIVQVINIGEDVTGNHSFDIQVPGAGQGAFDTGCVAQYPDFETDDFDNGKRYGGMSKKSQCQRLPKDLQEGCEWHFDWYKWNPTAKTNNPYVIFHRVKCPHKLTAISGVTPVDDEDQEIVI